MSNLLDRIREAQKRREAERTPVANRSNDNIFYTITDGSHRIRLVGEYVTIRTHWISPSKFRRPLFDESVFQGENALKKAPSCINFNPETELVNKEGGCIFCALRSAANSLYYQGKNKLDKKQQDFLREVALACVPKERHLFLCIDRDNPEISPGKKGYKIIEFPEAMMEMLAQKLSQNEDLNITGEEDGVDLIFTRKKDVKGYVYTLDFAFSGRSIATTPLTEEELKYEKWDILTILNKAPDTDAYYKELLPEMREILEDYLAENPIIKTEAESPKAKVITDVEDDVDEEVPF